MHSVGGGAFKNRTPPVAAWMWSGPMPQQPPTMVAPEVGGAPEFAGHSIGCQARFSTRSARARSSAWYTGACQVVWS